MASVKALKREEDEVPAGSARRSYWCFRVFIAVWIGYAGFYFCRMNLRWTPLPAMSRQGWLGGFADLLTLFGFGYFLGQFVGGYASDRFGARRTLLFGGFLSVSMTALLAASPPIALIMTLQTLNGFGQGFGWPAVNKLLSIWLPRQDFAIAIAWWSTSYALGGFLATALATGLSTTEAIPIQMGLRLSILVPAGILLLTTSFFFWHTKGMPADAGLSAINPDVSRSASTLRWRAVLGNGEIQLLALMYFFLKLTRYSLLFWLPVYLIDTQHATDGFALKLASVFELLGFLGALVSAYISDRLLDHRRYPVGAAMLFLLAFVFLLHPVISSGGTIAIGISIAMMGILIFGTDVLMSTTTVLEAVSPEHAGRASGFVNGVGALGQMLSPLLISLGTAWFGWNGIFNLFLICSLIAATLLARRWNVTRTSVLSKLDPAVS